MKTERQVVPIISILFSSVTFTLCKVRLALLKGAISKDGFKPISKPNDDPISKLVSLDAFSLINNKKETVQGPSLNSMGNGNNQWK